MNPIADDILMHVGMPRRSGRYPWGSGDDPYQHGSKDFLGRIEELKKTGWTETAENIKKEFGDSMTLDKYRMEKRIAKDQRKMDEIDKAVALSKKGMTPTQIGREMGKNESSVRELLKVDADAKIKECQETIDFVRKQVDKNKMVDVGAGEEQNLNISRERLDLALHYLETREGYPVYAGRIPQPLDPSKQTTQTVICKPGTKHSEIYDYENVHALSEDGFMSTDGGKTFRKYEYPVSMDSNRMMVRYAEQGGVEKDGLVEIRRNVPDLSLGDARYAQVRILVDDKKYIKGMAVYSDDMPDGVDIVFNTNKSSKVSKLDVLKDIDTKDPDNPFGALIKANGQSTYIDKNGKERLSLINKTREEGDWSDWQDALPSQFLSKQSKTLIKQQLDIAKKDKIDEYNEILAINNPTVRKHFLREFADNCDAAAVELKAAALPGQKYHVMIPNNSLKDDEVYAPGYKNGTQLALIRYPHAGTFEIPIVTVNNKHQSSKNMIGADNMDAICVNKKNADRLSGADYDGDTVMAIPTNYSDGKRKIKITSTPYLKQLEGFEPKLEYPEREGMKYMTKKATQIEMGKISNLITDMTLMGAGPDDLSRAVKHSMVVIDAYKHKLDYKKSEKDNNIAALTKQYQIKIDADGNIKTGGASTILSRAKGDAQVLKRQGTPRINAKDKSWYDPSKPEGALLYKTADDAEYQVTKTNKRTGEVTTVTKQRTQKSTQMAETDDAYSLVSATRHPKELLYADYANSMKALANQARKEMVSTKKIEYSATAKQTYQKEVDSLNAKLNNSLKNAAKERAALRKTNAELTTYKENAKAKGEKLEAKDITKFGTRSLTKNRNAIGSVARKDRNINITDREWEAIQAGAISEAKLTKILNNTDPKTLRAKATPKAATTISTAKVNKIEQLRKSGKTISEIADSLGVSPSTVSNYIYNKE